jgi:hypothetical protein
MDLSEVLVLLRAVLRCFQAIIPCSDAPLLGDKHREAIECYLKWETWPATSTGIG